MCSYAVAIVASGSPSHLADLRTLRARYGAIPHHYSSWPIHSTVGWWLWCRILGGDGALLTGFAAHLTSSRALPGTHIAYIDCLGRALHTPIVNSLGKVLCEAAQQMPRVLRLDARIVDEDPTRRREYAASLAAAGLVHRERRRHYSHTLMLELGPSDDALLHGFSKRVRGSIRKAINSPSLRFGPVAGDRYEQRIEHLYALPFERTGGKPPPIDVEGILRDSLGGYSSLLIGAFVPDRESPQDLVGLSWARLHGDHATLEINASERGFPFVNSLSPGFGLMWRVLTWARQRGARWVDLGGLPEVALGPNDPMRGVIEFKTRFCRNFREIAEEWQLEPHPLLSGAAAATRRMARIVRRTHERVGPWKTTQCQAGAPVTMGVELARRSTTNLDSAT